MVESCATVADAIAFYRRNWEPGFSYAKILVADRTGSSVIIGAEEGQLKIEKASRCRGFGYGRQTLEAMLAKDSQPKVTNGSGILRACLQKGQYATKYSNVFDLKSGDIFLFSFPERDDAVKSNLAAELSKGAHYYDIPEIRRQMTQAPIPLLRSMKRLSLDEFKPITDQEPKVTEHLRALIQTPGGTLRSEDYTADLWKELATRQAELQADLKRLGQQLRDALSGTSSSRCNSTGTGTESRN
jgi:hypothetical protein